MAFKNPPTPASRRSALHEQLELIRASHADACLAAENDPSVDNIAQRDQLLVDVERARQAIDNFEAAQVAAGRQATAADVKERDRHVAELRAEVEALSDELGPMLEQIVHQIEDVAPLLAGYVAKAAQRRQAASAAVRLLGGYFALERTQVLRRDGHDVLRAALVAAVSASGIGSTGPGLEPFVLVSPPSRLWGPVDVSAQLRRDRRNLTEAIDSAAEPEVQS